MVRIFSDQNDLLLQPQNSRSPRRILPRKSDMNRSRHMGYCELHRRTRIEHNSAPRLQSKNLWRSHRNRRRDSVECARALAVHFDVVPEILGPRWKTISQQSDELFAAACLKRIIAHSLFANGGRAFSTHLSAAQRPGSMRGKNFRLIRKFQYLVMQAVVEHGGKILRSVIAGKIRTPDIPHKKRVPGEDRSWLCRLTQVGQYNADALGGVAGRGEKVEATSAELDRIAVFHRRVRKGRARAGPEIDARPSALRKLVMTGDEIGVQVGFNDVLDLQALLAGGLNIDIHVALWINDRCDAFRTDQIRSVSQTPKEEVIYRNRRHTFAPP